MTHILQHELVRVETWKDAIAQSRGYVADDLIRNLLAQFQLTIERRQEVASQQPFDLSVRRAHLLSAWNLLFSRPPIKKIVVCDIGGGNGYMYDWVKQFLQLEFSNSPGVSQGSEIEWNVMESKAIAEGYQSKKGKLAINFLENIKDNYPDNFDLAIFSCVLQYVEKWEENLLEAASKSKYQLLMRVPLVDSNCHQIFVQHFFSGTYSESNASWPIRIFSFEVFLELLNRNFKIIFSGEDPEETFPFEGKTYPMRTFLLEAKDCRGL